MKASGKLIRLLLALSSFLSCIILTVSDVPLHYNLIPLLPFSYGLLTIFFNRIFVSVPSNVGLSVLLFLLFYRSTILPLIFLAGGFESVLKLGITENASSAIMLMIYELLAIFITANTLLKKSFCPRSTRYRSKTSILFHAILFGSVLVDVVAWFFIPDLHAEYRSIFNMYLDDFTAVAFKASETKGSLRILSTLFGFTFSFVRLAVPMLLIKYIANECSNHPKVSIFLSIIIISVQLLFVSSTVAYAIICCVVLLVYTAFLHPKQKGQLMSITGIGALIFIGFYFISRFLYVGSASYDSSSILGYLSMSQNAYFSGLDNVAAHFNIPDKYANSLWTDLKHIIPFNNTIFGPDKAESLMIVFNSINGSSGQIPTSIGSGYNYFGFLFSPLFSIILTMLCIKGGRALEVETNRMFYISYLTLVLFSAMGIVMYNPFISGQWIFNTSIPLFILAVLYKSEDVRSI